MLETDPREASGQLIIVKRKLNSYWDYWEEGTEFKIEFKLLTLVSIFFKRVLKE